MTNYIDGFVFPLPRKFLNEYKSVAEKVAEIWKEHGALSYFEYIGDDLKLEGTLSFPEILETKKDEVIVFGWIVFSSKETREIANKRVATDPRITTLVSPLTDPSRIIFNAQKMVYGGFQSFVHSNRINAK
jgi:uncharacterized protein YbaA (DUF1428 family)